MIQGLIHPLVFRQKFNSKYYSKHDFPEKFNSKNIQNLVFQKYSIQKLFKTFFSEIFNSKSYSFSDLWRNSIQKYYSKLDFFLDSIQKKYSKLFFFLDSIQKQYSKLDFFLDSIHKNIHSIKKRRNLPPLDHPGHLKYDPRWQTDPVPPRITEKRKTGRKSVFFLPK